MHRSLRRCSGRLHKHVRPGYVAMLQAKVFSRLGDLLQILTADDDIDFPGKLAQIRIGVFHIQANCQAVEIRYSTPAAAKIVSITWPNQIAVPRAFRKIRIGWYGRAQIWRRYHVGASGHECGRGAARGDLPESNKGSGAWVEPFKNDFIPAQRIVTLWRLLGAVGFVLLIACVNVANLLLARNIVLQKEMAVRSALGAKSATIFAERLTETLLLGIAVGALGIAWGYAMLQGLIAAW
jgi:HAMP domain-containing protein